MKEDVAEEEGPLGGQGNLEGLRDLTAWCKDEIMEMRGKLTADWVKEVVRRNAEMVAGWQVSRARLTRFCDSFARFTDSCMGF